MLNKKILLRIPLLVMAVMLTTGVPALSSAEGGDAKPAVAAKEDNVLKGKVLGVSKKAKSITIETKKGPVTVKFDDATKGMEFAEKGEAAIVKFNKVGDDRIATVIKPKLATAPEGVGEIQPEGLAELVAMGPKKGNYMLIDARPAGAYANGHIPTAHSIPVKMMEEKGGELMPMDNKDIQLIFYCGGVT
ncbi:MAG: rhodanese-like domain-containing protein [Proteobacteria bacterium]|nr:rhodanese-like domain-containing protein [Pseudomonadota bacterium]MBU1736535.1 rhodanese-like domain-containing protein [Pseudomonadota bacterium]